MTYVQPWSLLLLLYKCIAQRTFQENGVAGLYGVVTVQCQNVILPLPCGLVSRYHVVECHPLLHDEHYTLKGKKIRRLWARPMGGWNPTLQAAWHDTSDTLVGRHFYVCRNIFMIPLADGHSFLLYCIESTICLCMWTIETRWRLLVFVDCWCVGK